MIDAHRPYSNCEVVAGRELRRPTRTSQLREAGAAGRADDRTGGPALEIRAITYAEIEQVGSIESDLHPIDAWSPAAFASAVSEPRIYVCRVAVDPSAGLLGYAVVGMAGDQCDLQNLTVGAEHQRRGVGRRLLVDALDLARQRGARDAFLEVRDDNVAAVALYTSCGFEVVARRRAYYAHGVHAVVMHTRLDATGRASTRPDADSATDDTHQDAGNR